VDAAIGALKADHMKVADQREVLVVNFSDGTGSLGELARELAQAGVNVELVYSAFGGSLVIATDDVRSAREALS
jgi:hypothetical protein